uniref:hypothetical protein n=1 Tax=Sphingomonas bacterium TaxID=1895847 RepID=UPI0026200833|nr:hypothetical protein [Sphingomonas bacterium]
MTPQEMYEALPPHLRAQRPDGSYIAMRLIARMSTDLAELTQGKRAATYPEVDEYLGHALIAEGVAPRGLTAQGAAAWWRSGSAAVLASANGDMNRQAGVAEAQDPMALNDLLKEVRAWDGPDGPSPTTLGGMLGDIETWGKAREFARPQVAPPASPPVRPLAGVGGFHPPATVAVTPEAAGSIPTPKAPPSPAGKKAGVKARAAELAIARARTEAKIALRKKRALGTASGDPYSSDNLSLGVNEPYAEQIKAAARQTALPSQAVAAIIGAEAARDNTGLWNPKSKNPARWSKKKKKWIPGTSATGLTQFLAGTWIDEGQTMGSYLNGVARELGYLDKRGHIAPAHKKEFLDLRLDPGHSISAGADYAARNLAWLRGQKLILDESPGALARYAYLAHHEGKAGAAAFLTSTLKVTNDAWSKNIPDKKKAALLAAHGKDRNMAYQDYMTAYTDSRIDVRHYMIDPDGITVPATGTLYPKPVATAMVKPGPR